MFRGGAAVAAPTTITSSPRPTGRLSLLYQPPGGGPQQTPVAVVGPPWRRSLPAGIQQVSQQPPPPMLTTNNELRPKWSPGLTSRVCECAGPPKTEAPSTPQWKRKQEPEKKPEEPERKIEPLWKRIREADGHQGPQKVDNPEQQMDQTLERRRPVPLWKKKQEPGRLEAKPEPEKKPIVPWKTKEELAKVPEPAKKAEPEGKMELGKRQDPPKIEPGKKLDPLWKRKFEPVKTQETELKNGLTKKIDPPIWKRKVEGEKKPEPSDVKQEPTAKPVPAWKRKKEPEKEKKEAETEKKTVAVTEGDAEKTAEEPSDDNTEELLCPMCSELYDADESQPVLLPRCGHTFCRPCLVTVKGKGHFPCPTCRKRHLKPPVEELPVHNEVLSRATGYREDRTGRCERHKELLNYWCKDCQAPLCATCRVKNGHNVVRTKVVLKEKREELKEQGKIILDNVLEEKRKIMDSVTSCSAQLLQVCEASVAVDDSSQNVKEMLSSSKQTADLGFVLNSLQRMKSILGFFSKTTSDSEADESKTPKSRRKKEKRAAQQDSNEATASEDKKATPTSTGSKTDLPPRPEKGVGAATKVNNTVETRKLTVSTPTLARVSHQTPAPVTTAAGAGRVLGGSVPGEVMAQGPLLPMSDASLWPLTCCVYGEDGRRARLKWAGGRLHMHALSDQEEAAHFMIKLSVIQSVIPQDNPEVFLEVEAGDRPLGRIYIKLWGHLRRAHHYLALCMGTHGPSYRGAKFEEVFSRGLRGECLHAGPYITPSGDLSAQRVMDALEWDGQYKKIQRKGLVVGAGSGRADRDSCFDICTIENPNRHFACPFGEVVAGWETIEAILEYRPVRAVTMVDVGVVVPASAGALPLAGAAVASAAAATAPATPTATRTTTTTTTTNNNNNNNNNKNNTS